LRTNGKGHIRAAMNTACAASDAPAKAITTKGPELPSFLGNVRPLYGHLVHRCKYFPSREGAIASPGLLIKPVHT